MSNMCIQYWKKYFPASYIKYQICYLISLCILWVRHIIYKVRKINYSMQTIQIWSIIEMANKMERQLTHYHGQMPTVLPSLYLKYHLLFSNKNNPPNIEINTHTVLNAQWMKTSKYVLPSLVDVWPVEQLAMEKQQIEHQLLPAYWQMQDIHHTPPDCDPSHIWQRHMRYILYKKLHITDIIKKNVPKRKYTTLHKLKLFIMQLLPSW